jgi:hypothetical protein
MINPKNGINVVSNNNLIIVCSFAMLLLLLLFIPHQVVFAANTFVEENPSIAVIVQPISFQLTVALLVASI